MKNAIKLATATAATIGTAKIAGDPNKPPRTVPNAVAGSTVAAAMLLEDDTNGSISAAIICEVAFWIANALVGANDRVDVILMRSKMNANILSML